LQTSPIFFFCIVKDVWLRELNGEPGGKWTVHEPRLYGAAFMLSLTPPIIVRDDPFFGAKIWLGMSSKSRWSSLWGQRVYGTRDRAWFWLQVDRYISERLMTDGVMGLAIRWEQYTRRAFGYFFFLSCSFPAKRSQKSFSLIRRSVSGCTV
jgi:hypothetical protein